MAKVQVAIPKWTGAQSDTKLNTCEFQQTYECILGFTDRRNEEFASMSDG
jgi:hypothetical protein